MWTRILFQSATAAPARLYAATQAEPGSYSGSTWLRESRGPVGPARLAAGRRTTGWPRGFWDLSLEQVGLAFDF